ncbi:GNAT family N-acetyltransferase [Cryptosporangium japonicum]|uniref:N-acetyltransferase domain-containing protein n=1 Tax=Cryptosporangium japonicum TaxID=80872 RepID=A0ABP3ELU6_9ACTN
MEIRAVDSGDLSGIRAITAATGQSDQDSGADQEYVELIRSHGLAKVAVSGGAVLGWAGAMPTPLGTVLTDLFVDPAVHARGVGSALLRALPSLRFTFSSTHPAAMPLYVRAGLVPSWPLLYLSGPVSHLPSGVLRTTDADAASAASAEAAVVPGGAVHGAGRAGVSDEAGRTGASPVGGDAGASRMGGRAAVYRYWSRAGRAFVVRDGERVIAVGAGRPGVPGVLTHLTCSDPRSAAGALYAALLGLGSEYVALCLPGPHPALRMLLNAGFRIDDFDVAMRAPTLDLPSTWTYAPGLA